MSDTACADATLLAHGPAFNALATPLLVSGLLVLVGIALLERRDLR